MRKKEGETQKIAQLVAGDFFLTPNYACFLVRRVDRDQTWLKSRRCSTRLMTCWLPPTRRCRWTNLRWKITFKKQCLLCRTSFRKFTLCTFETGQNDLAHSVSKVFISKIPPFYFGVVLELIHLLRRRTRRLCWPFSIPRHWTCEIIKAVHYVKRILFCIASSFVVAPGQFPFESASRNTSHCAHMCA